MAALPGAGGSSTASWRTGPSPSFHHQLHSGRSRLPLDLSSQSRPEMLAESAQGDLPVAGSALRPGPATAKGAGTAPPRTCLLSAAGLWQEKQTLPPGGDQEEDRGLISQEESQHSL